MFEEEKKELRRINTEVMMRHKENLQENQLEKERLK
jgi:hypothetical protein